jgi:ElaB/YqjD/DUF883 family membrane-anchored ribosome-binding protein
MADKVSSEVAEGVEMAGDEGVVSARQRFQRLGEEVQSRAKKVSEDVRRGAERASHEIRRGAERARETYDEVAENAQQTYKRVRSEAGNLSREVSLYVRDNPGKALLIAAGVGSCSACSPAGAAGRTRNNLQGEPEMTELQERESVVDELIDELVPEGLDWERLVVSYPIPALLLAALGGFLLGRSHGPRILGALSGFAAAEISRQAGQLLDREAG